METAVRAHRILGALANYRKAKSPSDTLSELADARLGDPIGCYQNPGPQGETIGIFASGLAWNEGGCLIEIPFSDVQNASLPSEKASEGVLLTMQDGKQFWLPVRGQRGRFVDSMEMLRFLDRVIQDLRRQAVADR